MFSKILIANRGEIAVRIIRACKEMGISTVAVYSKADQDALHAALADEGYCIGEAEASQSYLQQERIISAALLSGAQAIHPGYGFLSENAEFAQKCIQNRIAFIGPTLANMRDLSDKQQIKQIMQQAGLTVIPGSGTLADIQQAHSEAARIGYPVMLKAAKGGGGRGIRLVENAQMLQSAFQAAVSESISAFGDGAVYMEKYIHPAKHIEMQIIADEQGHVVCLGERDCSIQQHNQKLVEESPSAALAPVMRAELIRCCARAVKAVGYVGVGTLEFLFDGENCYFMEMNVRLQVEHTVTEALTGMDLVKWQIRVAAGIPLGFSQEDVKLSGSAIECRINALAPGRVALLHIPGGPFVRFDTFLVTGCNVPPYYDALLGKLIVYAASREEALRKMQAALCELVIDGVPNNVEQQLDIIGDPRFIDGTYNLDFFK